MRERAPNRKSGFSVLSHSADINPLAPADMDAIARAIDALRSGQLVVFPTETFYGIAADALSPIALERIYALKGREPGKPIALIAADSASAFALARDVPDAARRLAAIFWPGSLTLVMPARAGLPDGIVGPDGVGVRVSSHPVAQALAAGLGSPITATSANLSGDPPAAAIESARASLGARVSVYLDGRTLRGGAPSTVVSFDSAGFRIVRAGAIDEEQIARALETGRPT
jgi:L-threonylcarbamoyladenylate synthase